MLLKEFLVKIATKSSIKIMVSSPFLEHNLIEFLALQNYSEIGLVEK